MVCHKCPNCDMEFNKKSNYLQHTNKKFKCIKKVYLTCVECNEDDNIEQKIQNNPKKSKKIQKIQSNLLEQIQLDNKKDTDTITDANTDTDTDTNTDKDADNFNDEKCICCPYCSKCYSTKSNLSKHLKTNCKIKKQQEEEFIETQKLDKENMEKISFLKAIEESKKSFIEEKRKSLLKEPDIKEDGVYSFKIKLSNGKPILRRFSKDSKIQDIRDYLELYFYDNNISIESYNLVLNYPKIQFSNTKDHNDLNIKDAIYSKNIILYIENLDE